MPPKQRFSKEDVIGAALNLLRKKGPGAISARALGEALGCSSRPIFTVFANMDELRSAVRQAAWDLYRAYSDKGWQAENAFKGVGMQYVRFAQEEPRVFELLFMTAAGTPESPNHALTALDENHEQTRAKLQAAFGLSRENALRLYTGTWIFTHGLACLCATGVSKMTDEELSARLSDAARGIIAVIMEETKGKPHD